MEARIDKKSNTPIAQRVVECVNVKGGGGFLSKYGRFM